SIYGALPSSTPPIITPELSFTFSPLDGTILNSIVIGPKSRTYFRISTDSALSGFTVVQNHKLESVAVIEWRNHPMVEISSIVSRRTLSPIKRAWSFSPEHRLNGIQPRHRIMSAREKSFRWTPSQGYIEVLVQYGGTKPSLFARLSQGQSGVKLEITNEAVHVGLLEVCVASAVLLMSGRNID
ncbi:hypothetical protein K438DRAFT_1618364, partial [Mycena galopus ATCC 62051]